MLKIRIKTTALTFDDALLNNFDERGLQVDVYFVACWDSCVERCRHFRL